MASRRPDLSGADALLPGEGERDAARERHTEWSRITLGGMSVKQWSLIAGSPIVAELVNLAARAGSGCPREGFKKARM